MDMLKKKVHRIGFILSILWIVIAIYLTEMRVDIPFNSHRSIEPFFDITWNRLSDLELETIFFIFIPLIFIFPYKFWLKLIWIKIIKNVINWVNKGR